MYTFKNFSACLVLILTLLCIPAIGEEPCATTLVPEASPTPIDADVARLHSVTVIAPDDIWAVGFYRTCTDCAPFENTQQLSLTMHYDGSDWSIIDSPTPLNPVGDSNVSLLGVDALSSDLIYAAGSANVNMITAPDTFALKWNGSSWQQIETPGQSAFGASGFLFEAVDAIDEQNIWFGGQFADPPGDPHAAMVHYDGSDSTTFLLPMIPGVVAAHRIRSVSGLAPNDVWAAGSAGGGGVAVGRNYVVHWDGSSWSHVPTPQAGFGEILRDVVAIASDDVWVCGRYQFVSSDGTTTVTSPLFLHWDGSAWTQFESPGFANALVALGPDNIYGVSGNQLIHWNGDQWTLLDTLTPEPKPPGFINLLGLDATTDCELVAVGMTFFQSDDNTSLIARVSAEILPGDMNGDGAVNLLDVAPFVDLISSGAFQPEGDINRDGLIDLLDVAPFIQLLTTG